MAEWDSCASPRAGTPRPALNAGANVDLTSRLCEVGDLLGIIVFDHAIVSLEGYLSRRAQLAVRSRSGGSGAARHNSAWTGEAPKLRVDASKGSSAHQHGIRPLLGLLDKTGELVGTLLSAKRVSYRKSRKKFALSEGQPQMGECEHRTLPI
ncbi:MAG TPA: hypothetical protein VFC39_17000 [Acidobacteriaceae bacterium]|nr:hypothetical protein [Acidobacteriaceae bacterium]